MNEKTKFKNYIKSNLIYDSNYSFYKYYHDILSLKSNHLFLANIFDDLDKFIKLKQRKEKNRKE